MTDQIPTRPRSSTGQPKQLFNEWIAGHSDGGANNEITVELADVVEAVNAHQKKGKLTIEIEIEPIGSGARTVLSKIRVTAKPPRADPEGSVDYVGDLGSLHRTDPYQQRLHLEQVPDHTDTPIPFPTED